MSQKPDGIKLISENRKARFDYELEDTFEAGLVLMGSEVKSIRAGQVNLKDSYIALSNGQAYLQKAHINVYKPSSYNNHEPERPRKLLLHEQELARIDRAITEKGYTCVPTRIYLKNSRVKLEIALARGKNAGDKRETIRDRDAERELARARQRAPRRRTLALIGPLILTAAFGSACATRDGHLTPGEASANPATSRPRPAAAGVSESGPAAPAGTITDEQSLTEDRTRLDELRKDIAGETKRENDELALILKDMSGWDLEPTKVRERFNSALRKRRERMDRSLRSERERFSAAEAKAREQFLSTAKAEREQLASKRMDASDRKRFFDEQDRKRAEFFAGQKDARKDFEERITERRKTFEDYAREQSNEFNQELRAYSAAYQEGRRGEEAKKRMKQKEKRLNPDQSVSATDAALIEQMREVSERKGKLIPLRSVEE